MTSHHVIRLLVLLDRLSRLTRRYGDSQCCCRATITHPSCQCDDTYRFGITFTLRFLGCGCAANVDGVEGEMLPLGVARAVHVSSSVCSVSCSSLCTYMWMWCDAELRCVLCEIVHEFASGKPTGWNGTACTHHAMLGRDTWTLNCKLEERSRSVYVYVSRCDREPMNPHTPQYVLQLERVGARTYTYTYACTCTWNESATDLELQTVHVEEQGGVAMAIGACMLGIRMCTSSYNETELASAFMRAEHEWNRCKRRLSRHVA